MNPKLVLDCECYRDYFLVMFRRIDNGVTRHFEMYPGSELDARKVMYVLRNYPTVGFNSSRYDIPMLTLACAGADNAELKLASDWLVTSDEATPWAFEKRFNVRLPKFDHVDLYDVAPGVQVGLKLYGGRMHYPKLQDLPIPPDASIAEDERPIIRDYCGNDLGTTIALYNSLLKPLALREQMSEQYGVDLRSKSDAQIAEAVIKAEIEARQGVKIYRPQLSYTSFRYDPPKWLQYNSSLLREVLDTVAGTEFTVADNGSVDLPKVITDQKIQIGDSVYRMGIGGLHSSEKSVAHVCDGTFVLVDRDVTSYYPSIILNEGLYPANLGEDFLDVYRTLVNRRLEAKRSGDKSTADSLKITINGSFGKLGSKWSVLYSPKLLIQVTVTGQLALLMLIERLEVAGIPVVSANTDGVVIRCPIDMQGRLEEIVAAWERATGFETEETRYKALYSRDVNNYIAVKHDGTTKTKGVFAPVGLQKNPANSVVAEAVIAYLTKGEDPSTTIAACDDVRKFVTVRTVKGGGVQGDTYLGKVVRWYYSAGSPGPIQYRSNGNKVSRSDGAGVLMELGGFPSDIDYGWYAKEAQTVLSDIGVK